MTRSRYAPRQWGKCVAIGASQALVVPVLDPVVRSWLPLTPAPPPLAELLPWWPLMAANAALAAGILGVAWVLKLRTRRVAPAASLTWDCGYACPSPRMQYTAASFAAPVLDPFRGLLHARIHRKPVAGFFPGSATEDVHFEDPGEGAVRWMATAALVPLTRLRGLQRGPVQLYLLYVLVTLLLLLLWQVRA